MQLNLVYQRVEINLILRKKSNFKKSQLLLIRYLSKAKVFYVVDLRNSKSTNTIIKRCFRKKKSFISGKTTY